jgi:hypothetical protein
MGFDRSGRVLTPPATPVTVALATEGEITTLRVLGPITIVTLGVLLTEDAPGPGAVLGVDIRPTPGSDEGRIAAAALQLPADLKQGQSTGGAPNVNLAGGQEAVIDVRKAGGGGSGTLLLEWENRADSLSPDFVAATAVSPEQFKPPEPPPAPGVLARGVTVTKLYRDAEDTPPPPAAADPDPRPEPTPPSRRVAAGRP